MQNAISTQNQNSNVAVLQNALKSFKEKYNLTKLKQASTAIALNSRDNAIKHLKRKAKQISEDYSRDGTVKTNLISEKKGVWITKLYLGKAVINLGDEQLVGEFATFDEAVNMINDFIALVEQGEADFVKGIDDAIARIATYSIKDRSVV